MQYNEDVGWNIHYYQSSSGRRYVDSFLNRLSRETRYKVGNSIGLLEQYGYLLGHPHVKRVDDQLWELRILGKVAVRIFYYINRDEIVLLHAIKKQSNKLPVADIILARKRLRLYLDDL